MTYQQQRAVLQQQLLDVEARRDKNKAMTEGLEDLLESLSLGLEAARDLELTEKQGEAVEKFATGCNALINGQLDYLEYEAQQLDAGKKHLKQQLSPIQPAASTPPIPGTPSNRKN